MSAALRHHKQQLNFNSLHNKSNTSTRRRQRGVGIVGDSTIATTTSAFIKDKISDDNDSNEDTSHCSLSDDLNNSHSNELNILPTNASLQQQPQQQQQLPQYSVGTQIKKVRYCVATLMNPIFLYILFHS
jgi:hypothetical protein